MHMADGLINTAVAAAMYGASVGAAAYSIHNIRKSEETVKVAEMGIMGAFVFAAQMINFAIPGTGSSGHMCGALLLSAMLGPSAGFITMVGILLIQCLFFADGGIMALGANIWNMAFYGCFLGTGVVWRIFMRNGASKKKIVAASVTGCVIALQLGAFSVVLETLLSGITALPFGVFAGFIQPIHLAVGLIEGAVTAAVLCFVYEAKPDLIWGTENSEKKERLSYGRVMAVLGITALITGGGLSLLASSLPDGLEWSIGKTAEDGEIILGEQLYDRFGTSFSGIIGGVAVIGLCLLFGVAIKAFRKRKEKQNEQV